jgi:PAT family beta-lactamase induction signal transducer AmpG
VARFLDAFRSKRVWLLIALGFASGMPLLLSGQTLTGWLTDGGVKKETIGLFALVTLPYNLKVFWAPLLDRYALPFLGRRRGWIALFQVALAIVILVMSAVDPSLTPARMAALAVLLAFCSASQDVVSDAYRADILPAAERASGTATFITGYRIAMLVAGSAAFILADHVSWSQVYLIMAALLVLVGLPATFLAPEPEGVRPPRTLADAVIKPFSNFFSRPGVLIALAFVLLYKFGEYVSDGMTIPFLRETGFSNTDLGAIRKFVGFGGTILGVMLGGGLYAKWGPRRSLLIFGILEALTNGGYLAMALVGKSYPLLVTVVAGDTFCRGLAAAALGAFMLSLCDKSFSATQLALLSSASTLAGRLFGASSGYLATTFGWPAFYGFTIVMAAPALLLLPFIRMDTATAPDRAPDAPPDDRAGGSPPPAGTKVASSGG